MAYITADGETLEMGKVDFNSQQIEAGTEEWPSQAGGFVKRMFHPAYDDRVNGGENMSKFYQAIILDKKLGVVTGESYVTAENKNQAFAKVDTSRHNADRIKVFLNKIGEYKPQE